MKTTIQIKIVLIILLAIIFPQAYNYFPYPIVVIILYATIFYLTIKSILKTK